MLSQKSLLKAIDIFFIMLWKTFSHGAGVGGDLSRGVHGLDKVEQGLHGPARLGS